MKKSLFKGAIIAALVGASTIGLASCSDLEDPVVPGANGGGGGGDTLASGVHKDNNYDLTKDYSLADIESDDKTIVFHHTMGDALQGVLQTAIDKFQAAYPGWTVTATQIGGYDDVKSGVIAGLSANNQPDLAYCYADHVAQYIQTGKVVDMSDYINATGKLDGKTIGYSKEEVEDFVPGYYAEGKATNYGAYKNYGYEDNDMLTLPYVKSTEVMYYNKTVLDELGLKVPTTWDELWAECSAIRTAYPRCTPLGYDSEANWIINMCAQNGWGYTSADDNNHYLFKDDAGLTSWLDSLTKKYDDCWFTTQQMYGTYTSGLFTKGPSDGGSVFSIGSSGGASHQATDAFTWGVAPIPGSKRADGTINKSVISQGPSLVMFQSEKNTKAKTLMTWEFVKYLEDPAYQASFSMASGYNPARQSSFEIEDYAKWLKKTTDIAAVTAGVASQLNESFFTSPAFSGSSMARNQMQEVLKAVAQGQQTASAALQEAYSNCSGN